MPSIIMLVLCALAGVGTFMCIAAYFANGRDDINYLKVGGLLLCIFVPLTTWTSISGAQPYTEVTSTEDFSVKLIDDGNGNKIAVVVTKQGQVINASSMFHRNIKEGSIVRYREFSGWLMGIYWVGTHSRWSLITTDNDPVDLPVETKVKSMYKEKTRPAPVERKSNVPRKSD